MSIKSQWRIRIQGHFVIALQSLIFGLAGCWKNLKIPWKSVAFWWGFPSSGFSDYVLFIYIYRVYELYGDFLWKMFSYVFPTNNPCTYIFPKEGVVADFAVFTHLVAGEKVYHVLVQYRLVKNRALYEGPMVWVPTWTLKTIITRSLNEGKVRRVASLKGISTAWMVVEWWDGLDGGTNHVLFVGIQNGPKFGAGLVDF